MPSMDTKQIGLAFVALALGACTSMTTPHYDVGFESNTAIKGMAKSVNIGNFGEPNEYVSMCRGVGKITPPEGVSIGGYIRNAFIEEFKAAEAFEKSANITLSGSVEKAEFSSSKGLVGGEWNLSIRVVSTNGKTLVVTEKYEFSAGFAGVTACGETAVAFAPAVQALVKKTVTSPEFFELINSEDAYR